MKRRPNKPKPNRPLPASAPKKSNASASGAELPAKHKWLFRLTALVLVPLLLLGGLETILRLAGYGSSNEVFKKITIDGQEFLVNDDSFSLRFFPPEMTRSPSAFRMTPIKPPDTYRIFILGESAAMGDPEPAYGAGRYLQALLRERFPAEHFEIINLGITAINSHVILPLARECAREHGDLWLIYMGNNEMVGPFGAATVFGAQAPPLAFVRLSLAIQQTRIGQLLKALSGKLKGKSSGATAWGGMQMFVENKVPPDDPRRKVVYRNFQKNLADIVRAGLDSSAQVLLSTVAVNLKDSPPFATSVPTNLARADSTAFQQASAEGFFDESKSNYAEAAQRFEQAAGFAPQSAGLQFELGRCALATGNASDARRHLQSACDLDALPFRADSQINNLVSQAGFRFPDEHVRVFDAAAALATNSPADICGQETFYEHVHFNFDGNYQLARAWAGQIESMLPPAMTNHAAPDWAGQDVCEQRLALTDWNRAAVIESVIQRMRAPPLSTQPNNEQRIATLQNRVKDLRARMDADAATQARAVYLDALQRAPDDYYLHENFAIFLQARGKKPEATAEWRQAHELMPQDFVADFQLGNALAEEGKFAEAEPVLLASVAAHPGFTEGWMKLGDVHSSESKLKLARAEYERAQKLHPQDPTIPYRLGAVLSRLNLSAAALQSFRESIRLRPDYWEAHYLLGGELGMHDQVAEARSEFEQVIRLKPDHAGAHLNLGVALLKQGRLEEAQKEFEETLRLEPGNKLAPGYLKQAIRSRRN